MGAKLEEDVNRKGMLTIGEVSCREGSVGEIEQCNPCYNASTSDLGGDGRPFAHYAQPFHPANEEKFCKE